MVTADIVVTGQKPDIVIVKRQSSPPEVALVELTVPWESSSGMERARSRKEDRYKKKTNRRHRGFRILMSKYTSGGRRLRPGAKGYIIPRNKGSNSFMSNDEN